MPKRKRTLKKGKKDIKITDTKAWIQADWDYSGIVANDLMPLLGPSLKGKERVNYLMEIFKRCPDYYPALLELGSLKIMDEKVQSGREFLDKAFQSLKMHFTKEELLENYYKICEFLENKDRFELAIEYYNDLLEIDPDKANIYDLISHCYANLDNYDKAIENQQKALDFDNKNHRYYSNFGWIELLRGNLNSAKTMLEKSLELNPNNEVALNNYKAYKTMKKENLKNWEEYLLRKTDYENLEKLEDKDEWEEYEELIQTYNENKLAAFRFDLFRNQTYFLSEKQDILFTLKYFFDFMEEIFDDGSFLYCDVTSVEDSFKSIMHKFIFKTGDIDEEIFNDVYSALLEFYKFLEKKEVIDGYKSLKNEMLKLKPELLKKMRKYNRIRHNDNYTEEQKEEIRYELFEGDHELPFL